MITIASDDDVETGYMLVNEHTPETADERLAWFVLLAAREWGLVFDACQIQGWDAAPIAVVDDPENETWRPVNEGEQPTHRWYAFTNLYKAEAPKAAARMTVPQSVYLPGARVRVGQTGEPVVLDAGYTPTVGPGLLADAGRET